MAYIDELLGGDETVLYVGRQHLFILVGNIVAEIGLIALMIAAGVVSQAAFRGGGPVISGVSVGELILFVCLIISAVVLASALFDYLRWLSTEYVITNHRVIRVRGLFNKESTDSSLDKINDVELRQSWLGRLFDYGDIEILTASEAMVNVLQKIGHPLDFKRAMLDAKQQYINGFGYYDPREVAPYVDVQPHGTRQDLEGTLHTLADLRDRGLLSNEEFETKKAELLKRI